MSSETIEVKTSYEIDPDGKPIAEGLEVHRITGDSEFDYCLVGSNPDSSDDESTRIAFGFHADELQVPLPEATDESDSDLSVGTILQAEETGRKYQIRDVDGDEIRVTGLFGTFEKDELRSSIEDGELTVIRS